MQEEEKRNPQGKSMDQELNHKLVGCNNNQQKILQA